MSIVAVCPSCKKQYQVNEKSVGKSVRCKACQNVFTVKAATTKKSITKQPVAVGAGATTTSAPATDTASGNNAAWEKAGKQYGLNPLPKNPNWSMPSQIRPKEAPDPLAGHVVTDPGFPYVSAADYQPPGLLEEKSIAEQYMEAAEDENEAADVDHGQRNRLFAIYGVVVGSPIIACLLFLAMSLSQQDINDGSIYTVIVIGRILFFASFVTLFAYNANMLLTHATFIESLLSFVIFPFFYFYVTFKYFNEMKHTLILTLLWMFSAPALIMGVIVAIALLGGAATY